MPKTKPSPKKRLRAAPKAKTNPLLGPWRNRLGFAPFSELKSAHFRDAFAKAIKEHRAEIEKIAGATSKPTFQNTIVVFEKSGKLLDRTASLFSNIEGTDSTEELQAIARDIYPKLAGHESFILLHPKLFRRVDEIYQRRDALELTPEERRVLERNHLQFVRAGARLVTKDKRRVGEINARLASLVTQFMQNVLKSEQSWRLVLDRADLAGLPEPMISAARRAAEDQGLAGKYAITLARSSVEGFLQFADRRDLREEAFKAWARRGEDQASGDNRAILSEIVRLRTEHAQLLGYKSFADYSLADTMAKTPAGVNGLLQDVWPRALKRAKDERDALQERARAAGENFAIAAWDWRYFSEKVRKAKYDLDEAVLHPYLELDNMIAAAFDCATRLFGLKFQEIDSFPKYNPEIRAWTVIDKSGADVGIFIGDYFARTSKRSGAWMSSFRSQHKLGKGQTPIIINVLNFTRAGQGEPVLLSFDDARTLFHEFGHGLHGLLSNVTYPSISGTSVSRDFVELPSQLYEHWLSQPEVLKKFARHVETGKPIPDALIERWKAARNFNQGFATVEYTACALVDMALYATQSTGEIDIAAFERQELAKIGMPAEIIMRHRLPHFMHIVGGYAAGYYSYMWSEVMDADAFAAFEESGDIFDRKTAKRLKEFIYSAGNSRDPADAYVAFRGRPPKIDELLKKRGMAA